MKYTRFFVVMALIGFLAGFSYFATSDIEIEKKTYVRVIPADTFAATP